MEEINLKLTINEINQILNYLGLQKYQEVYILIDKIQTQANNQIEKKIIPLNKN